MDDIGEALLRKVSGLLDQRRDVSRQQFGRAIQRGHSWISEFFNGLRTTNDLRLVLKMARFFRVPCSYLVNDDERPHDDATITLLGAWRDLAHDAKARAAVLNLALALRPSEPQPLDPPPAEMPPAKPRSLGRAEGRKRKHR